MKVMIFSKKGRVLFHTLPLNIFSYNLNTTLPTSLWDFSSLLNVAHKYTFRLCKSSY